MLRTGQIVLPVFLGMGASLWADAQQPSPNIPTSMVSRMREWGTSEFASSSEEWTCRSSGEAIRIRFVTTTKYPTSTRVYLDNEEIDAASLNEIMKVFRPTDVTRIDVVQCATKALKNPHYFEVYQTTFPGQPTYPIAKFSITADKKINLVEVYRGDPAWAARIQPGR